jgi:hypothetical protein
VMSENQTQSLHFVTNFLSTDQRIHSAQQTTHSRVSYPNIERERAECRSTSKEGKEEGNKFHHLAVRYVEMITELL